MPKTAEQHLLEAQQLWDDFHTKYEVSADNYPVKIKKQRRSKPDEALGQQTQTSTVAIADQQVAASKIQGFWRERLTATAPDKHVKVSTRQDNPDFNRFINEQTTLRKSLNLEKRKQLLKALGAGNWEDPIFKDEYLGELVLSLAANKNISVQQRATLFERVQTQKLFQSLKIFAY